MTALRALLRSFLPAALVSVLAVSAATGCSSETSDTNPDPDPKEQTPVRPEGVKLCYTDLSENHAATKAFRAALGAGDKAARAQVIEQLEAAVEDHPEEEQLALYLGLAQLWRIAEPLPEDQAVFVATALGARENLQKAYDLCPTDYRIPAWLGPVLVNMGRQLNQQATIDQGLAVLQEGIDHYPSFVLFSKLLVYANEPAGSPDFQNAVDAVFENIDYCTGDDGKLIHDPACQNTEIVYHNVEGSTVFLGDVFAKAGRKDDALTFYTQGQQGKDHATWDFQDLLAERIATLDARIAAHATEDTADDPETAWNAAYQCAVCHTE